MYFLAQSRYTFHHRQEAILLRHLMINIFIIFSWLFRLVCMGYWKF